MCERERNRDRREKVRQKVGGGKREINENLKGRLRFTGIIW